MNKQTRLIAIAAILLITISCQKNDSEEALSEMRKTKGSNIETKNLDQLYKDAQKEGCKLLIYAGGDSPDQQDYIKGEFKKKFPKIDIEVIVDLSKYHNVKINNEIARNNVKVDIAQLQTLNDFYDWKNQGSLLSYKPKSWRKIYNDFKDQDGYFTGVFGLTFSNVVNREFVTEKDAPRDALDYLKPQFKDKLILTYPHDDDAVLFQFRLLIDKYGWGYLDKLIAQNPTWVRGTEMPALAVGRGDFLASFTTFGTLEVFEGDKTKLFLPKKDEFVTWMQTAAILKDAPHPAAAKLYMNWIVSKEFQDAWFSWSIRTDVDAPGDYVGTNVFDYNTSHTNFKNFMMDRHSIDFFKLQLEQKIGPVVGVSPLDMDYTKRYN